MRRESYKNKAGAVRFRPIIEEREEIDNTGFCLGCGTEQSNVEPDARKYMCESCELPLVYGLEELILMEIAKVEFRQPT